MATDLVELVCEFEAIQRWERGEAPGFSTGICDGLTCGYGECSFGGYWQFPLYPAEDYQPGGAEHLRRQEKLNAQTV
jgi:hypothetical protein